MVYKIINKGFYFPKTEQWIMDSFKLKLDRAVLYQLILNKGFITWSQEWMASVLQCSVDKVKDMLKELLEKNVIVKRTVNVSNDGVRLRSVYVALYNENGLRDEELIKQLLNEGQKKIECEYSDKRYYKRDKE